VTLASDAFMLDVEKGSVSSQQSFIANIKKEEVQYLGQDIRYIKTQSGKFISRGESFIATPLFWLASLLPIGFWILAFILVKRKEKIEGNIVLMKQIRATKIAQKYLKNAKKLVDSGLKDKFYEETARALWTFVAHKLNIKPTDLTKDNIREKLLAKVDDEILVNQFIELINICEEVRYSPGLDNQPIESTYFQSVDVLSKLSEKLL
ncbi:MAG: hypothetical protein ACK42Z_08630, partial [Candidatus Kapaibacteriota bacterium]